MRLTPSQLERFTQPTDAIVILSQKREYVRDEQGQFAEVYHGAPGQYLETLLKEGLQLGHAGENWKQSHKDQVYVTLSRSDAQRWAEGAAGRLAARVEGTRGIDAMLALAHRTFPLAILTIRIPPEHLANLQPDENMAGEEEGPERQFKGNIPPEWIVGARIAVPTGQPWPKEYAWQEVPLPKRAADGQLIYVVVVLHSSAEAVEKFDPSQPRDDDGKWTRGLHLRGEASKPERLVTSEFEARYPEEKRLYLGVPSSAVAERAREGGGKIGSVGGIQAFQSVSNAQVGAQSEERDQGIVMRFGIKPEARVKKLPSRLQFSSPETIDKWATEHKVDIVNVDDLEFIVKNPAMVAVDSHDYTLRESTVLEYERQGYILDEYEAEKAAIAALRQATASTTVTSKEIPPYQQARALLQDAVGAEIPVGVDDHPVAIRAAQEIADVLTEMRAKGYKMPREIEVRAQQTQMPAGEATHDILQIKVPDNLPDDVSLDQATLAVYGEDDINGVPKFVPRTFKEIVVHEMGHINQRPANRKENKAAAQEFEREMKAIHEMPKVVHQVSRYAGNNADEFVAEVFTKLYRGDTVPPSVMRVYRGLRGGEIR